MSFIVVTSTAETVLLDLNAYEQALTTNFYQLDKRDVMRIVERTDFVEVWLAGVIEPYLFSHQLNTNNYLIIESVNGDLVSSTHDLAVKLMLLKDPLTIIN